MPLARRLSNSSHEAFEEFCRVNQPLSRRRSNSGISDGENAQSSSRERAPYSGKQGKSQENLKKRLSMEPRSHSNRFYQFSGSVPKPSEATPKGKIKRSGQHDDNRDQSKDEEIPIYSPTPYWKAAAERGWISPRETRAAKKRKSGLDFDTIDTDRRDRVMIFSPPDQAANAKREKMELEQKTKERNTRIAMNREKGQILVFHRKFENLDQLPVENENVNENRKGKKPTVAQTQKVSQSVKDPPVECEQSFSSVSMNDEAGNDEKATLAGKEHEKINPGGEESEVIMKTLARLGEQVETKVDCRISEWQPFEIEGVEALNLDKVKLTSKMDKIRDLEYIQSLLTEQNENLVDELNSIEAKISEERRQFSIDKEQMKTELDELKGISQALVEALRQSQENCNLLEKKLLPESEEQLKTAIDNLRNYEAKIEEATSKISEYEQRIETLMVEKVELSCSMEKEKTKAKTLSEDSHKMLEYHQECSKKKDARIRELQQLLETVKHDLKQEQALTQHASEELKGVAGLLKASECEKEMLKERLVLATEQIHKDTDVNNQKSAALKLMSEQNQYLQMRLKEVEEALKKSHEERDDAIMRLGTFDQRECELFDKLRESDRIRKEIHARLMVLIGSIRTFVRVRPALPIEMDAIQGSQGDGKGNSKEDGIFKFSRMNGGFQALKTRYGCDDPTKNLVSIEEPQKDRGGLSQRRKKWTFGFDQVFPPHSSQEDVWEATEPLVQSTVDGFNVTVFAYGQTGSGKTYTMLGNGETSPSNDGIVSRAIRKLFYSKRNIEELSQGSKTVSMSVEMLEIYNENVRDLLASPDGADGQGTSLKVVANSAVGSTHQKVETESEVFRVLKTAEKRRCVKSTRSNANSSRSHLVFSIVFAVLAQSGSIDLVGRLNICDLAGSERVSKSGATGSIMTEAQYINRSLSALSNVIEKLQAGDKNVPYRDSKLTSLLQNSLGGNSKTLCIVCCSPLQNHFHETLTSLRFAAKIGRVDLKAVQNVTV